MALSRGSHVSFRFLLAFEFSSFFIFTDLSCYKNKTWFDFIFNEYMSKRC